MILLNRQDSAGSQVASELRAVTDPKEKGEMTVVSILFPLIQQISRKDKIEEKIIKVFFFSKKIHVKLF